MGLQMPYFFKKERIMIKKIVLCMLIIGTTTSTYAQAQPQPPPDKTESEWKSRYGVRFGYSYLNKGEQVESLSSPHSFLLGYEMQQTLDGGEWLDILFVENISVGGLDQSVFSPSLSLLVGFEFADRLQVAVGTNISPVDPADDDKYIHLISAIGYTAAVGRFSLPIHLTFIPDVNGFWRCAATAGVNW